jgi:hypothetical protein
MGRIEGVTNTKGYIKLSWAAARDSESGVSSYHVVYLKGARPPRRSCVTGNEIHETPVTSNGVVKVAVTGLTVGERYTFRVCALDAAGNVAAGKVWGAVAQP